MLTTQKGFTLIELMIVLVIIGILSAIIYPSYSHYVIKAHRAEAQIALLDLAAHMQRYQMEHKDSYEGATLAALHLNPLTPNRYYQLAITDLSANAYLLQAIPQKNDPQCGVLTLNQLGQKSHTGHASMVDCFTPI